MPVVCAADALGWLLRVIVTSTRSVPAERQLTYYQAVLTPLEGRVQSIITSDVMRTTPGHGAVVTALTRALCVYRGVAKGEPGSDRAPLWASAMPLVEHTPALCDTYRCDGTVAMAALSFFLAFTETHVRDPCWLLCLLSYVCSRACVCEC